MKQRRVRPLLLFLLWTWAACVFVVLDLFKTVPALDRVRPEGGLYRGMRVAAHRMIGEPLQPEPAPKLREQVRQPCAPAGGTDLPGETARRLEAEVAGLYTSARPDAVEWRAARIALERLACAAPEREDDGDLAPVLDAVRGRLHQVLRDAEATDATVEALLLGELAGDAGTANLCVALLHRCDAAATREEALTRRHALRCVAHHGEPGTREEAARWLMAQWARARDRADLARLAREEKALHDGRQ